MIRLSYTQYAKEFVCKIENIEEISVPTLQKLEDFAAQRSGKLDYSKESLVIPKRIELHHLQQLFDAKQIPVFITEKEARKSRVAETATINFGKFKGQKWTELSEDYLLWLANNINSEDKQIAIAELARRREKPAEKSNEKPKELTQKIGFGKYKGQEWGELPVDYLSWVVQNLQGYASACAKTVLDYKNKY